LQKIVRGLLPCAAQAVAVTQPVQAAAPAAATSRPRGRLRMLVLLGALSAFGPLSMDMYLPSTPAIAASLRASQPLVQLTMSACLAGLAAGQLIAGPVSDSIGRRLPLLTGLAAFSVLSVACALAPDIGALIVFRFLQGMAGAAGIVLSLAMVRDLYRGPDLARILGSLMLVFGVAPVLAPVIGGQVLRVTSWRGVFGVLAAVGVALLAASWRIPETLPPRQRSRRRLGQLRADSRRLLSDPQYGGNALAIGLSNAALITYISALPFIVEDAYRQSPQLFSLAFAINALGLTAMSQIGARLVRRRSPAALVRAALAAQLAGGAGVLAAALTGHPPLIGLLVPLFVFVSAFGMMRPNAAALALAGQGAIAGTASAYLGAIPFLLGAAIAPVSGTAGSGAVIPAAIIIATLTAAAPVARWLLTRRHRPRPHTSQEPPTPEVTRPPPAPQPPLG
jgi:MFS transporter, DHA1 family, multidrug resistance protein